MKTKFYCEYCNKEFTDYNECIIHENACKNVKIQIKAISLTTNDTIVIMDWPNAIERKNKINLMPHLTNDMCNEYYPIDFFQLDKIKISDGGDYIIYTKNFDKEYENKCIINLLNEKLKNTIQYNKKVEEHIKYLKSKNCDNIVVNRQTDYLVENLG